MTPTSALLWRKEVRELLPWWAGTVVTMAVCWALMRPDLIPADWLFKWALDFDRETFLAVGVLAYAAGAVTLGALSLGQEYAHQTLPTLLAHPVSRRRILLVKLTVLATMLSALGTLAFGAWGNDPMLLGQPGDLRTLLPTVLPLASGLLLAPWLTMVARGALGGAVFTAVLPAFLWMAGTSLRMPIPLLWTASVGLGVFSAVMTWRTFMRLQVTGGIHADVDVTAWFSRSASAVRPSRSQSRVALLVKKELRLQQPTFIVAGLYVAVWLTVVIGRSLGVMALPNAPLFVATFVNTFLVPVLAGALASAEERRLDAADWHTLLPLAGWKQWAIKAGVVVGIAFALAVMLPMSLATLANVESGWRHGIEPPTVIMVCIAALYVSSLSPSGLRALLTTVPAVAVAVIFAVQVLQPLADLGQPAVRWLAVPLQAIVEINRSDYAWWMRHGIGWLAAGFFALVLAFAYANHRSTDRSWPWLIRQFGWLSAYAVAAVLFLSLIGYLFGAWLKQSAGH